ncbi:alpha-L-rhamnosidase C-terminal domain-containing protein [Streptomyces sp. NPDC002845]
MRGRASVGWRRSGDRLRLAVEVLVGAEAEVHVPAARRQDTAAPRGAEHVRSEPGHVVYRVPHGSWEFTGKAGPVPASVLSS